MLTKFGVKMSLNNGEIFLEIINKNNKNVAKKNFYKGASKLSGAIYLNEFIPCFYIMHIGGGFLEKEVYVQQVHVQNNAFLVLTNQAPTHVYKCTNENYSSQIGKFYLEENAVFEFANDAIILFENANFKQEFDFYLKPTSTLIYSEIITSGYSQNLQKFSYKKASFKSNFYIENSLIYRDFLNLEPKKNDFSQIGFFENFSHIASAVCISKKMNKDIKESLHVMFDKYKSQANIGISLLQNGVLTLRILGNSTDILQKMIKIFYDYLRKQMFDLDEFNLRKY